MVREIKYEILDDTKPAAKPDETPREFKGKYITQQDGKKLLVVQAQAETIEHPDGRKDVIIHAPVITMDNMPHDL